MSPRRRSIAAIRSAPRAAPARLGSGTSASKPGTPSCVALSGSVVCTTSKNSSLSWASCAASAPSQGNLPVTSGGTGYGQPVRPGGEQAPQLLPGPHPLAQPADAQVLVGGVQVLVGGREREEQRLDPERLLEQLRRRERAGDAGQQHRLAGVDRRQRGGGGPDGRVARRDGVRGHPRLVRACTSARTPGAASAPTWAMMASITRSGSWPGTRRQDTCATAACGITVYLPPPDTPLISSVGRSQRRSSVLYPASPCASRQPQLAAGTRASSKGTAASSRRRSPVSAGMPS